MAALDQDKLFAAMAVVMTQPMILCLTCVFEVKHDDEICCRSCRIRAAIRFIVAAATPIANSYLVQSSGIPTPTVVEEMGSLQTGSAQ